MDPKLRQPGMEATGFGGTWSDFTSAIEQHNGTGSVSSKFEGGKLPDVFIFDLGYHSSKMSPETVAALLEDILRILERQMKELKISRRVWYLLKMMPRPEMIPNKYKEDRAPDLHQYPEEPRSIAEATKF